MRKVTSNSMMRYDQALSYVNQEVMVSKASNPTLLTAISDLYATHLTVLCCLAVIA